MKNIELLKKEIVKRLRPVDPESVILFGSHAYGKPKVPRTHSTLKLYGMIKGELAIEIDIDLLTDFDSLYIDARYPGDLGLLPDGKPSLMDAREFYDVAQSVFCTINGMFFPQQCP